MRAVAFPLCCERVSGPRSQKEKGVITCCRFAVGENFFLKKIKLKINSCRSQSQGEALGIPGEGRGGRAVHGRGATAGKGLALPWPLQTRGGSGEDFIWQMGAAIELMQ